jgi:hypothetical protein
MSTRIWKDTVFDKTAYFSAGQDTNKTRLITIRLEKRKILIDPPLTSPLLKSKEQKKKRLTLVDDPSTHD